MKRRTRIDNDLMIELGNRLREVRVKKNIRHEQVNESLKIIIYRYEKAKVNISLSTLALICKYYKVPMSEILEGLESSLPIEE